MRPAGPPHNPNPALAQLDPQYHDDEAAYRAHTSTRTRTPRALAFKFYGQDLMFDTIHPRLETALELHKPERERSVEAKHLAAALRLDEFHPWRAIAAKQKLLSLLSTP